MMVAKIVVTKLTTPIPTEIQIALLSGKSKPLINKDLWQIINDRINTD